MNNWQRQKSKLTEEAATMDIYESLSMLRCLYQVGNLSQWILVDSKKRTSRISRSLTGYTIIVILISIALLVFGLFSDQDFNRTNDNDVGEMVDFIQMVGIRIAHLVSITEALMRFKDEMKFYVAVKEIDRIFKCSLNIDVDNRLLRRRILQRGAVMLIIYLGSEIFILVSKLITRDSSFSIFWLLYMFPFLICGLRYFQIFSFIMIIKSRFDSLISVLDQVDLLQGTTKTKQENIKFISEDVRIFDSVDNLQRRIDMENPEMKRLLTIRDIYNRLWELNCIVNRCVGVSMLVNVANDFISITSNCYWIFLNFKEYSSTPKDFLQIAGSTIWSLPHLFNVLFLAIICEKTVKSTTNIALSLHSIKIDLLNDNHNILIEQFSMQLLHQKLAFTAAGFFNVDCTLLYTIVGATTTYLIILIQFHMSEQKSNTGG